MAHVSSKKAARARRATTRPLAIRALIFVGAASACLTLGLTLFRPAPMERSGLIALEGGGNSTSLSIPIASGNMQAFPPSSARRGDDQRALPKKRSAISDSQRLRPGEDIILQRKDINRSSEETGKVTGPPISKGSTEGLTLKAFEKKRNDSAINGVTARDSETRSGDYPEDKVQAFTLWDEFPSNAPGGQIEAHYGGQSSFGLPALTVKPENRTGTYAANCSDLISASMLVTLTATDVATDVLSVSEFDSTHESALETSSPEMMSPSMLVTMSDVDGIPSEIVPTDATASTMAGSGVSESSGDMTSSAEVVTVGSSEVFTEEISTDQSTAEMASPSIPVTVGSSEVFTEEISTDQSTAEMASPSIPVTDGSSEVFTEEISTDQSTAEIVSRSIPVTDGSSEVFTEEISTDQSTAEMASSSIPVTDGSSEVFMEEISIDQSTAEMASSSIPVTDGSSEVFTEEISSGQGSVEMASSSMPVTNGDQETVTEVISSETKPAETFSSTLLVTGAVSEIVTEVIDSENTPDVISIAIPVTSGYSEAVSEIIKPDESTTAGPVITAVDAITATDLIDFTEEVKATSNWSTAQLPRLELQEMILIFALNLSETQELRK
nr:uncharacterized protein LOC129387503 [Dermacentor andersoni]